MYHSLFQTTLHMYGATDLFCKDMIANVIDIISPCTQNANRLPVASSSSLRAPRNASRHEITFPIKLQTTTDRTNAIG